MSDSVSVRAVGSCGCNSFRNNPTWARPFVSFYLPSGSRRGVAVAKAFRLQWPHKGSATTFKGSGCKSRQKHLIVDRRLLTSCPGSVDGVRRKTFEPILRDICTCSIALLHFDLALDSPCRLADTLRGGSMTAVCPHNQLPSTVEFVTIAAEG